MCVAVCCSVLQCRKELQGKCEWVGGGDAITHFHFRVYLHVVVCVAVRVLQCVHCSVLQCVAVPGRVAGEA